MVYSEGTTTNELENLDFKGLLAWLVKLIAPKMTDEWIISAMAWLMRLVLRNVVHDPETAQASLDLARRILVDSIKLIDEIEAGNVPTVLFKK